MLFKNKKFEVRVKKDEQQAQQVRYIVPTADMMTDVVDKTISAIVTGAVMYKGFTTAFKIIEHVVVTKVK